MSQNSSTLISLGFYEDHANSKISTMPNKSEEYKIFRKVKGDKEVIAIPADYECTAQQCITVGLLVQENPLRVRWIKQCCSEGSVERYLLTL